MWVYPCKIDYKLKIARLIQTIMTLQLRPLLEKVSDQITINKQCPSYYTVVAQTDIEPNQIVYLGQPYLKYIFSPELSKTENWDHLIGLLDQEPNIFKNAPDLKANLDELYPRKLEDCSDHLMTVLSVDKKAFTKIDEIEETIRNEYSLYCKVISNCFGKDSCIELYKTASYFNHSCVPNCMTIPNDSGLTIVSVKKIKQGDELTITLGRNYLFDSKSHRQSLILSDRHFVCKCRACVESNCFPTQVFYAENESKIDLIDLCHFCGQTEPVLLKCRGCERAQYCTQMCQKRHWKLCHSKFCKVTKKKNIISS
jgi:hypothetical protein